MRSKLARYLWPVLAWLLLLLIVLGVAACAADADISAEVCTQRGDAERGELRHGRLNRNYRMVVPDADEPLPLVVALHGGWGTGAGMAEQTGLDDAAQRYGFAVVYPDGIWRSWNAGTCCGRAAAGDVDDVGFIRELVRGLTRHNCIDGDRVYGTGFSNGAMMVHRMTCEAPELFAAIAPVAGGPMTEDCTAEEPVPALLMVGREDERIPWDGGVFDGTYRPSIIEQLEELAGRNGFGEEAVQLSGSRGYCRQRTDCSGGALRWCIIEGVGHQWPGGATILPGLLGPNRDAVDATDRILRFFAEQD